MSPVPKTSRFMGRRGLFLLALVGLLGVGALAAQPVDIRPEGLLGDTLSPERTARGRSIVARGVEAPGGQSAWGRLAALRFRIEDVWDSTPFRMYMPLAENHVSLSG